MSRRYNYITILGYRWLRKISDTNDFLLQGHSLLHFSFWHNKRRIILPFVPLDRLIQLLLRISGQKYYNCGDQAWLRKQAIGFQVGDLTVLWEYELLLCWSQRFWQFGYRRVSTFGNREMHHFREDINRNLASWAVKDKIKLVRYTGFNEHCIFN